MHLGYISSAIDNFPYVSLFVLLILGGIGLPFPEDATLILGGFLVSTGETELLPTVIVLYTGLLSADFFLYSMGRKYGRKIVTHKRFHRILSPEKFQKLENQFIKRGSLIILLGRHLIGLRAQIFIVAGVMHMSKLRFIIADAIASIFTLGLMVGAGYIGGNSLQIIGRDIKRIEHFAVILAVTGIIVYLFYQYLKKK